MGSTITIIIKEDSTLQVHYTSYQKGEITETRIHNNEILREFNVNRILFDAGRNPFLRHPTIDPPRVYDFIREVQYILKNTSGKTINQTIDLASKFVNEFAPRLARVGDQIVIQPNYSHIRNAELIFSLTIEQIDIAQRFYGTKNPPNVTSRVGGHHTINVADLLLRIEDYVLNVRRR